MIMMMNHYFYSWLKGLNYITASALWGVLFCLLFVFREGEFMCLYFLYSISHPLSPYPRTKAFTSKTSEHTQTHTVCGYSQQAGMCMHVQACMRVLARVLLHTREINVCVDTHSFKVVRLPLPSFFLRWQVHEKVAAHDERRMSVTPSAFVTVWGGSWEGWTK